MADILDNSNFSRYLTEMDHLGQKLPLTKGFMCYSILRGHNITQNIVDIVID